MLASSRDRVDEARRWRKRLGGGMRQSGVLAAAGLYALDHHFSRLADDHRNARILYDALAPYGALEPESNIVMLDLRGEQSAEQFCGRARDRGVLATAFGERRVRLVTHLDAPTAAVERAANILSELAASR